MATQSLPANLARGSRLGPYTLIKQLSRSLTAEVWEAATTTGAIVALKFPRRDLTTDTIAAVSQSLSHEFRVTSVLRHPNVVRSINFHAESTILVMELIHGSSLRDVLIQQPGKRLTWEQFRLCAIQITTGLAHAHAAGIVHLDFKPANIVVANQRAVIIDFGLSRSITGGPFENQGFALPGFSLEDTRRIDNVATSPGYTAPEQILRQPITEKTDAYYLGATLYKVLSGGHVFSGTGREVIRAHVRQAAPRMRHRTVLNRDGVPRGLADLVAACLEKQPENRPTVHEVAATLTSIR